MINNVFLTKMRVISGLIYWSSIFPVSWLSPVSYFLYCFWLGFWVLHGFKLVPLTEKWLNNQGDQIRKNPGIFMRSWEGRGIPEKSNYFLIKLFKVWKSCMVSCRNIYLVNWTIAHPIFSSCNLLKLTFFLVHNNRFFQTGKNSACGLKFEYKLES